MTLRAATLARGLAGLALVIAGGLGCYQSFGQTIARYNPAAILVMGDRDTPTGQSALAQIALLTGRPGEAAAAAGNSLAVRPLDPATLRNLALAHLRLGDNTQGAEELTLASQLGWRDEPTQQLLFGFALRAGDLDGAAIRIDALARQKRDWASLFESARAMLLLPGAPRALAERLAEKPEWRVNFTKSTDLLTPMTYPAWVEMLAEMEKLGAPAKSDEIAVFERTLIAKGQPGIAIAASRRFGVLRKSAPAGLGKVAQGGDQSPFIWSVDSGREGAVSQARSGAISVTGDGQAASLYIQRVFPLAPGNHTLRLREHADSPNGQEGFGWTITCLPSGTNLKPSQSQQAQPPSGDNAGTAVSLAFGTNPECPAVRVALSSLAGQIPGTYSVSYSDLHLE